MIQQTPLLEVLHDIGIGVLDELARERIGAGDAALQVYRLHKGQPFFSGQAEVFVTKGRGDVDDTGAVLHGNELGGVDLPGISRRVRVIRTGVGRRPQQSR